MCICETTVDFDITAYSREQVGIKSVLGEVGIREDGFTGTFVE